MRLRSSLEAFVGVFTVMGEKVVGKARSLRRKREWAGKVRIVKNVFLFIRKVGGSGKCVTV